MRFAFGLVLLMTIFSALALGWVRHVQARSPAARMRKAKAPHGMIDVPLAPKDPAAERGPFAAE